MSKTPQLPLPLGFTHRKTTSFLVGDCNRAAAECILGWPDWPGPVVYLHGPAASGKSHLAGLWAGDVAEAAFIAAERLGTASLDDVSSQSRFVVDGIERLASEEALFHIANEAMIGGGFLLITGRAAPRSLSLRLPDLMTRLAAAAPAEILSPDEIFLAELLLRLAEEARVAFDPALAAYCASRMERTQLAAVNLIAALNRQSLAAGRPVSRDMAAAVLDEHATR